MITVIILQGGKQIVLGTYATWAEAQAARDAYRLGYQGSIMREGGKAA